MILGVYASAIASLSRVLVHPAFVWPRSKKEKSACPLAVAHIYRFKWRALNHFEHKSY